MICGREPNFLVFTVPIAVSTQSMTDMDKINRNILRELETNGRISNAELSNRVALSPSACLRRVQDLERSGVIKGYRAVIDRKAVGVGITIFVLVGLSAHLRKDALAFEAAMEAAPEVRECHNITGAVEYMLRVEVAGLDAYKAFHANTLGILPQVASITSHISLGSSKDLRG